MVKASGLQKFRSIDDLGVAVTLQKSLLEKKKYSAWFPNIVISRTD
jgi:hypothetical protein